MIPKITQQRPNVAARYWCGTCGASLPNPHFADADPHRAGWKYCPICGEPIEYDKATPVQWSEQNCERCGSWLIMKMGSGDSSYFMASSDYVGAPICRVCMEDTVGRPTAFSVRSVNRRTAPMPGSKKVF